MAIVLIFGIPGSGKTTLAQEICRKSAHTCHLVSFDAQENDLVWDESSFKTLRRGSIDTIKATALSLLLSVSMTEESRKFPGLIVVDDIMYLRSMRRQVYVVARDCGIPIIVVWVNTPLEVALQRNSQRVGKQRIDEQTIIKIHHALEPPDVQRICDRVNIVIDGFCECSIHRGIDAIMIQAQTLWEKSKQDSYLQNQLNQAPVQPSMENESFLKLLDKELRNVVAYAMKQPATQSLLKPVAQSLGTSFATAKTHILNTARRSSHTEETQRLEMRVLCVEFVNTVEKEMESKFGAVVDCSGGITGDVNDVFDLTRVHIADKFSV